MRFSTPYYRGGVVGSPPTSPPPPATSTLVLTRTNNTITWGGQVTKLWGVNFRPWQVFDVDGPPTWTDAKRDRSYEEIGRIKTSFGGNYVRINIAPGEFRFWKDPARNRFWGFLDGLLDRVAAEGMFCELNWWTVSCPDGVRADDSFFSAEYAPGYDSSKALCREFWTEAALRYKARGYVVFSLWDEPIKAVASDTWAQLQPWVQELVTLIRAQGAPNLLSIPGNHYSMMFQEILTTHPLSDPLNNWGFRFHAFLGAGEPQNYALFTTSGGTLLDSVRPFIVGGAGHEPVTLTEPPAGVYKTWLDTHVYPKADALSWWDGSAYNTPNLYATGYPTNAATTYTNYGLYAKANPIAPRLSSSDGSGTSPPPSPPPPVSGIDDPVPVTSANVWLDSVAGNDASSGATAALAVRTWTRAAALMGANKTLAVKAGSEFNQQVVIDGWTGSTIAMYGAGARPLFRYSTIYTSGWTFVRNITGVTGGAVYRIPIGTLPQSTPYAAARVTHATIVIVNDSQVLTWYARNGSGEVGAGSRVDMFHHPSAGGDLHFCCVGTPTRVEVPYDDAFRIRNSTGFRIQDMMFGGSRGHAMIAEGNQGDYTITRCHVRRSGVSGLYLQLRNGAATNGISVLRNLVEDVHAEGIVVSCGGGQTAGATNLNIAENVVRRVNKGPPFIFAGSSSQDFYSAGIKIFTELNTSFPSSGYIQDNTIEDIGDLDTPYYYATGGYAYNGVSGYESNQGQGIWPDTVNGAIVVRRNIIRRTWSAGVFIENSPGRPHVVEYNLIEDTGQQPCGWTGGVCLGRNESGAIVRHNTIVRPKNGGIVLQGSTTNQFVENFDIRDNLIICQNADPFVIERSGKGNASTNWRNNLFRNPNSPRWGFLSGTNGSSTSTFWNAPTYYTTLAAWTTARGGLVTNCLVADPLVSATYVPQTGSPLLGAATDGLDIGKEQV